MSLTIEIDPRGTARKSMPVILLVDVSGSMAPVGIAQANQGIRDYIDELQRSEDTKDSVFLSIVTFGDDAQTIIEHKVISSVTPPQIQSSGCTSLDKGIAEVLALVERNYAQFKKGKEPLFVLITDGNPTCSDSAWQAQLELMNKHPLIGKRPSGRSAGFRVIAGAGDDVNDAVLTAFRHDKEKSQIVRLQEQATISNFLHSLRTLTVEISEGRQRSHVIGAELAN